MNRRLFIASMVAAPAAVKAVATAEPRWVPKLSPRQLWIVDWRDIDIVADRHTAKAVNECWSRYHAERYGVVA